MSDWSKRIRRGLGMTVLLTLVCGLALAALLLSAPQAAALGAARAMAQWYASVAPALFPFLALMPLLTCDEAATVYELLLGRAMRALFDLPGSTAPALAVGMIVAGVAAVGAGGWYAYRTLGHRRRRRRR